MPVVTCKIAGVQHHEGAQTALNKLRRNDAVMLVRDPSNEHDANAIAVYLGEQMLGFVPMARNANVAAAMDRGDPVRACIFPAQPMIQIRWPDVLSAAERDAMQRMVRG
jgi:hypothetical protein